MEEKKPIFNLFLAYEDALTNAREFQASHKSDDGKELTVWEDPKNFYDESIKVKLDGIFAKTFDDDIKDIFEVGTIEKEARAALIWLIERHKGFNPLELGQVIVGVRHMGIAGDEEVALFTYLSKADDCLRDFIFEKAFDLVDR